MSDRTIIRPGGRRPRKNKNDETADSSDAPLREDEDDRTQVRTQQSEPAEPENESDDRTQVRPKKKAPAQDSVPPELEESDDKTQVRPKTSATQKSEQVEPEADSDDRTRVRPVSRRPEDTQSSGSGNKEIDWSEIDNAFALLDDDDEETHFRDRDVEVDADD
ncbi:MAG: hypothetical protein WD356_01565, partial [Pseudomonadales bacterium]